MSQDSFYLPQVSANLSMAPDPNIIPSFFVSSLSRVWHKAITTVRQKFPSAPPGVLWRMGVTAFLELCDALHKDPYANRAAANGRIITHLRTEKMRVAKWLNNTKMLKSIEIKRAKHFALLGGPGFLMIVDGLLQPVDHNQIHQLFDRHFRWRRKDRAYVVELKPHVTQVRLTNEAIDHPLRWHLSYVIRCNELPALQHTRLPTKKQLELVIEHRVWPAVTNTSRPFDGMGYRI